jgi:[protein-PII] uridylyltransferase
LWSLPQAYILHTEIDNIKRHLTLSRSLKQAEDIVVDARVKGEHASLTIIARDRPGLFAMLAGVLACNHLDVVSAKIFTWLDGIAVDEFIVRIPWEEYADWHKIGDLFRLASTGNLDMDALVSSGRPLRNGVASLAVSAPSVSLDNLSSDFYTAIEVSSPRRFGLLYSIASAMSSLGLDIHRAFLSHSLDPCTDVFYVVDRFGEKITDEELEFRIMVEITGAITKLGGQ